MLSVNPSSFAEVCGATTNTKYSSGCFRFISVRHLLKDKLPPNEIHPIYQAIGTIGEERFFTKYPEYTREVPFTHTVTSGVILRGRTDGISPEGIAEVKTSCSQSVRSDVINKGNLPTTYLGQILTYMFVFNKPNGLVSVSYVHFNKLATELKFITREFKIENRDNAVYIDGAEFISDLQWYVMSFYTLAAHYIESDELAPKPVTESPCNTCVLSQICSMNLKSKQEFVEKINMIQLEIPVRNYTPLIKNHDTKL